MPKVNSKPVWGKDAIPVNNTPGDFYFNEDTKTDKGNGKVEYGVTVRNDDGTETDIKGDKVFALIAEPGLGFDKDVYEFEESKGIKIDSQNAINPDSSSSLGLNTTSTTQAAYVVIYDDENPSRKTKGNDSANNIDLKGTNNSDTSNDTVLAGAGDDIVDSGKGNDIVFGQKGNDKIWGKEGDDVLVGGEGDDYLNGGDGKDILDGGFGGDTLEGGNGDDTYIVDNVNDKIIDKPGTGIETVISSVNWDLKDGSGLDNLSLTGNATQGIGNNLNNTIYGNSQNNTLDGKGGDDTIYGYDPLKGAAFDSDNDNDNINGGSGNDKLYGGEGVDTLTGGDGNDILDGGSGGDTLEGGFGNDIYIVDNVNDKIIDSPQTGIETVKASVDWILGAGLDNLILENGGYSGTGNDLNNTITGNYSNNILDGGIGNDILIGKDGNDTLTGGFGADTFVFESLQGGIDQITDFNYSEGDKIQISKVGFGATSTSQFAYDNNSGALTFNGSQFATLQANLGSGFIPSSDINLV
jgi:Ca2+-binding RTX toxin-like protein